VDVHIRCAERPLEPGDRRVRQGCGEHEIADAADSGQDFQ
jgi:hypothetical protein